MGDKKPNTEFFEAAFRKAISEDLPTSNRVNSPSSMKAAFSTAVFDDYPSVRKQNLYKIFKGEFSKPASRSPSILNSFSWEYVIVLKNPDFFPLKTQPVTVETAEALYRSAFKKKRLKDVMTQYILYAIVLVRSADCSLAQHMCI